jgi:predicted nucleic-acid-binding Zn-ribbon protein
MEIKCTSCGHTEKTDKDFFVKLIGGAMPVGGFWAWTTYLFAGTGFAMAIVLAIIGGGVAMLIFKDEIVEWIINKDYKCPKCGEVEWKADDEPEVESEISENIVVRDRTAPASRNSKQYIEDTIAQGGKGSGKLLAELLKEDLLKDDEPADNTALQRLLDEESLSNKAPPIELQDRIIIAEALLRSKGCEFDREGGNWIVLESSGYLKQIDSIYELEQYAISL